MVLFIPPSPLLFDSYSLLCLQWSWRLHWGWILHYTPYAKILHPHYIFLHKIVYVVFLSSTWGLLPLPWFMYLQTSVTKTTHGMYCVISHWDWGHWKPNLTLAMVIFYLVDHLSTLLQWKIWRNRELLHVYTCTYAYIYTYIHTSICVGEKRLGNLLDDYVTVKNVTSNNTLNDTFIFFLEKSYMAT